MTTNLTPDRPLFFMPNRVWRCYLGGVLLDRFVGNSESGDDYFPEDWLASTTRALNGEHSQGPDEGLSRVQLDDGSAGPLLAEAIASDPEGFLGVRGEVPEDGVGVLCKYLDSAVRLPIQCHPDRAFAREHYDSEHGKTESWIVLDSREIDGQEPYLLMGFKPGISREDFARAVREQDIPAMEAMLHSAPVRKDDVWFIPGRFPHAIGPGAFILEVQEPSDWVVQPERFCAGTELTDANMWGPLDPETGLDCFDYRGEELDAISERLLLQPAVTQKTDGGTLESVIGPAVTDCFCVDRLTATGEFPYHADPLSCRIGIVTCGAGEIAIGQERFPLKQGVVFFLPYQLAEMTFCPDEQMEMYLIRPGAGPDNKVT